MRPAPEPRFEAWLVARDGGQVYLTAISGAELRYGVGTCVWRWQERFMHEGVDGLVRDKSRPPGKAPVAPERVAEITRRTLEPYPRFTFHFTPTSCSWLNAVEGFFAKPARRRLKHGGFHCVVDPPPAINPFVREDNARNPPAIRLESQSR